jgi:hypothetical protein
VAIEYERFERSRRDGEEARTIAMVDALAAQVRGELEANAASIDLAHIHGASSSAVQEIVSAILKEHLGFDEEVLLTHEDGILARPRPDFAFRLGPGPAQSRRAPFRASLEISWRQRAGVRKGAPDLGR